MSLKNLSHFGVALLGGFALSASIINVQAQDAVPMSIQMVQSEMNRVPEGWMLDFSTNLKWNYCHGLEIQAFMDAADVYPQIEQSVYDYAKAYCDTIIDREGNIRTYKLTNYTLDHINPGKILFRMFQTYKDPRYKKAMDTLYEQLQSHPRTSEGGFWHKKAYPHQMWLDGIYMEAPYYAAYAATFLSGEAQARAFDDVVRQFTVVAKHTYDPQTKLYKHAWDESKSQKWSNPDNGQAPHVWGRAEGWFCMAMVDVLDYLPTNHPGRDSLLNILRPLCQTLTDLQDSDSGAWYQVLDCSERNGNYLETSCTSMFCYTFLKGALKGYLPAEFWNYGVKAYNGLNEHFIQKDVNGDISITRACAVAGLGGTKHYRDGSFEYYIGEPIRNNDPKAVAPYIMASLMIEQKNNTLIQNKETK